eukprot:TRINITY_DN8625_c0_g1_i1.p1 TRINITY_DN8625_c0_g1~~TRINITY_DN8625_c0_g1_i1.p1  ORF type:complete len:560 (+),score=72.91 TRINITY_DN8625_c0_g1_i1:151-1830(+)
MSLWCRTPRHVVPSPARVFARSWANTRYDRLRSPYHTRRASFTTTVGRSSAANSDEGSVTLDDATAGSQSTVPDESGVEQGSSTAHGPVMQGERTKRLTTHEVRNRQSYFRTWEDIVKFKEMENSRAPGTPRATDLVLGIETSCDDTAAAVVTRNGTIKGQAISSHWEVAKEFGGVVPALSRRDHENNIDRIVESALSEAEISASDLSAVSVTIGPGLAMCLAVGVRKAKEIALAHDIPLIPVNHIEAHALTVRMRNREVQFPFLALIVSGGHTQLLHCEGVGKHVELGSTCDDALGEAYDKTCRLLSEHVPMTEFLQPDDPVAVKEAAMKCELHPGHLLELMARNGDPKRYKLPVPLARKTTNCNFSFAGLKSAVSRLSQHLDMTDPTVVADLAASFQETALKHVMDRTSTAFYWLEQNKPATKLLVVSGGVARNSELRSRIIRTAAKHKLRTRFPPSELCADNGAMVAWNGIEKLAARVPVPPLDAVDILPRWPLDVAKFHSREKRLASPDEQLVKSKAERRRAKKKKEKRQEQLDKARAEHEQRKRVEERLSKITV